MRCLVAVSGPFIFEQYGTCGSEQEVKGQRYYKLINLKDCIWFVGIRGIKYNRII